MRSIFRLLPTEQLELQMAKFCRKADIAEGRFNENFLAAVAIIILGPFNIQVSALRPGRGDRLAAAGLGSVACRSFLVECWRALNAGAITGAAAKAEEDEPEAWWLSLGRRALGVHLSYLKRGRVRGRRDILPDAWARKRQITTVLQIPTRDLT